MRTEIFALFCFALVCSAKNIKTFNELNETAETSSKSLSFFLQSLQDFWNFFDAEIKNGTSKTEYDGRNRILLTKVYFQSFVTIAQSIARHQQHQQHQQNLHQQHQQQKQQQQQQQ
jgi:hypothetical protein